MLEQQLAPHQREPHSVIGSSCIGASVLGGVCNNSGGALVRRGPAYTELALYAQVDALGELQLINHLGVNLGNSPEEILTKLEQQQYRPEDIEYSEHCCASDQRYVHDVAQVDADTPARFNADPSRLFEASGSAGKVCVFAVRLDTFEKIPSQVFYIGSNQQDDLTAIRRFYYVICRVYRLLASIFIEMPMTLVQNMAKTASCLSRSLAPVKYLQLLP